MTIMTVDITIATANTMTISRPEIVHVEQTDHSVGLIK